MEKEVEALIMEQTQVINKMLELILLMMDMIKNPPTFITKDKE